MSTETPPQTMPQQLIRSSQWRVIYTNATALGFGENDVRLTLGFDLDLAKPGSSILEEAIVAMPLKAAKMLAYTLNAVLTKWEAVNGPIPIAPEKFQEVDTQVKAQGNPAPRAT